MWMFSRPAIDEHGSAPQAGDALLEVLPLSAIPLPNM